MKNALFLLAVIIFGCGGSEDNTVVEKPVANNDVATTAENSMVVIDVLSNDILRNNASISNYDAVSVNNGTITSLSNRLNYTPANNFVGTDTFSYTICDALSSPNCSSATVTVTVTDTGNPSAVNDNYEVTENSSIVITTLLDNDDLIDGATLSSVDSSSSSGTVVLNDDNTVSYTAQNGFSGEDTFTYTICDTDPTPSCATATVVITVLDEGNPTANDDTLYADESEGTIAIAVLDNDVLIDDAVITTLDDSSTQGTVALNSDGTISYTVPNGFVGSDSFTYTICDDDQPDNFCDTALVTVNVVTSIPFNIPSALVDYYSGVVFSDASDLMFDELSTHTTAKHTTILSYGQRHEHLYNADEDLNNADNVILMYSGESRYWEEYTSNSNPYAPQTFNTEHVYPQSLLNAANAVTDLHHLRVCDAAVNSARLNYPFADGSGTYKLEGETWYPGDEWKGDVARMMMYLNIRYGEGFNSVGSIELFIKWNIEDPVSPFEEQRNTVIYAAQGNRNPFIDNPYLATLIWGGNDAENKWE